MSVATREHLKVDVPPLENPCPDLVCWSLNREQKERGLALLQRTRKELGERQLRSLYQTREALLNQFNSSDDRLEQARIDRELKALDFSEKDIQSRWS